MFEKFIKDSFDNYEAAYDPKDWPVFENKLNQAVKARFFNKIKIFSIIGSAIIVGVAALYFLNNNQSTDNSTPLKGNTTSYNQTVNVQPPVTANDNQTIKNSPSLLNNNTYSTTSNISTPVISSKEQLVSVNEEAIKKPDNLKNEEQEVQTSVVNSRPVLPSETLTLSIDANKVVACAEEEVSFFSSVKGQNYTYVWNFGDDNTSSIANPSHAFNKAGSYDVRLALTDKNTNAIYNATIAVVVNKKPEANFEYEITQEGLAYPQVRFYDKSSDAMHWEWHFGDGKVSYDQNPQHVYFINSDKKINVSLSATSVSGCKSRAEKALTFTNVFDLMAPNAFSPDGDGLNDFFMPKALELYDISFEMFIYDRSGTMVFTSKSKSNPWDGRIGTSGIIPESGTYVWIVILKDKSGNNIKYSGTVSIVM